ncbi:MAG: PKD domain-containing protein [candidate division WOR-3 bacterium]
MKKNITLTITMLIVILIVGCDLFSRNKAPLTPNAPVGPTRGAINVVLNFKATTTDPDNDSIAFQFNWGGSEADTSSWSNYIASGAQITMSHTWTVNDTYYIKVRAKDINGAKSDWSPTHMIAIVPNNAPPAPPMPSGPSSGIVNDTYAFSTSTTDPDGDSIAYRFDWGDGDTSNWSVYYASGATATMTHVYTAAGTYFVRVQAKDQLGAVTDWSNGHGITITSIAYPFTIALTWGPHPRDLDAHCWTPSQYHVYYGNRGHLNTAPYCSLDVDDVDGYGPEHITISQLSSGTYKYAVHHFSGDSTIPTSGAVVKVYRNGVLFQTFTPPAGTCQPYWYWHVFNIDGATGNIIPINTYSSSAPGYIEKLPDKK